MAGRRARLDRELVRRGLASSRGQAQELIDASRVMVEGAPAMKAATQVAPDEEVTLTPAPPPYASRGGHKLSGALAAFGVSAAGHHCLDAGASTGGFTDVLLQAGARRVIAVDVGYGQLAWRLRADPRVVVLDRTNVRDLTPAQVPPPPPALVAADLSFISLTLVVDALAALAAPAADHLLLVKPQFEAGRARVGKGGVVRDPAVWAEAITRVAEAGRSAGLGFAGATVSPLPGLSGNVEFFVHLHAGAHAPVAPAVEDAVAAGLALARGRRPDDTSAG